MADFADKTVGSLAALFGEVSVALDVSPIPIWFLPFFHFFVFSVVDLPNNPVLLGIFFPIITVGENKKQFLFWQNIGENYGNFTRKYFHLCFREASLFFSSRKLHDSNH